jgi:hypothetical protein
MTVVVTGEGGGEEPARDLAHEVGEHNAKIEQHESKLDELGQTVEQHTAQLADIPQQIASTAMAVPEEVWQRLGALEDKVASLPAMVADQVEDLAGDVLPDDPAPVQPHKKSDEPVPKTKSSNPILSLLRRF